LRTMTNKLSVWGGGKMPSAAKMLGTPMDYDEFHKIRHAFWRNDWEMESQTDRQTHAQIHTRITLLLDASII